MQKTLPAIAPPEPAARAASECPAQFRIVATLTGLPPSANSATLQKNLQRLLAGCAESVVLQDFKLEPLTGTGPVVCPVCGWRHDAQFTQFKLGKAPAFRLGGVSPDIVALIHRAHANGFNGLQTKDPELVKTCGGYGNPCKVFTDLKLRELYQRLFDTTRRGFIAFRAPSPEIEI